MMEEDTGYLHLETAETLTHGEQVASGLSLA